MRKYKKVLEHEDKNILNSEELGEFFKNLKKIVISVNPKNYESNDFKHGEKGGNSNKLKEEIFNFYDAGNPEFDRIRKQAVQLLGIILLSSQELINSEVGKIEFATYQGLLIGEFSGTLINDEYNIHDNLYNLIKKLRGLSANEEHEVFVNVLSYIFNWLCYLFNKAVDSIDFAVFEPSKIGEEYILDTGVNFE